MDKKTDSNKSHIKIGTMGHVNYGKTDLVREMIKELGNKNPSSSKNKNEKHIKLEPEEPQRN